MNGVGERIKKRRVELSWTQDQLCQRAGISKGFLVVKRGHKSSICLCRAEPPRSNAAEGGNQKSNREDAKGAKETTKTQRHQEQEKG